MSIHLSMDSQIHRDGMAIIRQLEAVRKQIGNLPAELASGLDLEGRICMLIVDVAAVTTDDGSTTEIRAFLNAAKVSLPEEYLPEC